MPTTSRASTRELLATGRALRHEVPRSALAELPTGPRYPLGILEEQNSTRVPELVPLRTERMSQSPFAFFRGTAALMAADLAGTTHTDIGVAACGDAHLANFGFYASPQRTLVFDLNDFDEAAWAPWEWDLKRLVTSVVVAGRDTARSAHTTESAARATISAYRAALRASLSQTPLQRYYAHVDPDGSSALVDKKSRRVIEAAAASARRRTGERAVRRLTTRDEEGTLRFVLSPPTMTEPSPQAAADVHALTDAYRRSAAPDIRILLSQYAEVDLARRVVGVGSVGTRCALSLFQDGDGHGLILQSKEAGRSVLEQYGGIAQPAVLTDLVDTHGEGARVVTLQRILQSVSDPFLGYLRAPDFDMYVRQFHDMKGGVEVGDLGDRPFVTYARACAVTLARAHSQSPRAAEIVGYIGRGEVFVTAMLEWAHGYADLSEQDFRAFTATTR